MKLSTLILISMLAPAASAASTHLPFIDDDYIRARADANRRHLPLFIEVWAPW